MVTQFCFLLHYNLFLLHYNLFLSLVSQVPSLENFPAPPPDSAWVLQSRDGTESMCWGRAPLVTLDIQVLIQLQNKHFHYINVLWASDMDFAGKRSIVLFVRRKRTYQKILRYSSSAPSSIHEWGFNSSMWIICCKCIRAQDTCKRHVGHTLHPLLSLFPLHLS